MNLEKIKSFILPRLEILKRKILGNGYIYKISNGVLEIFFPKICFNCQREGDYLCQDCLATMAILNFHQKYSTKNLNDLYFGLPYQNNLIKKLVQKFKYPPFIKELSQVLASIIINHFQLLDNMESFSPPPLSKNSGNVSPSNHNMIFPKSGGGWILIPVPLGKKRLRWRGFNQAEEIGKHLSFYFKIPLLKDVLMKIKETPPQVELEAKTRKEILRKAFFIKNKSLIENKKIILVDDIYTTGSTMEECARILKEAGAKEIIGIVVARASPGQDKFQNL